ncbi:hypothetical protein LSCM4_06028 [Leishmania orientalis]|uniref:Uncharacterized protein n=1 Tax=Leishmania orientalis TaxID=2249476 RepID=A0A836KSK3_9TRYP|nr:hypothetical protein LSCM4_06028 [Leishmania orientalis]
MFTTEDPQDIIVLKTAAFRHATRRIRHAMLASAADAASPPRATPCQDRKEEIRGAHNTGSGREPFMGLTTRSVPCFTFKLPIRSAAGSDAGTGGGGITAPHALAARAALQEALQKHEDVLRAWADEPVQHISSGTLEAIAFHSKPAALLSSAAQPRHGLAEQQQQMRTEAVHMGCQPSADNAVAHVAALAQPYCRVFAQGSMARIGVPPEVVPKRTAAQAATPGIMIAARPDATRGEASSTPLESSRGNRSVTSTFSSSCAPQPLHSPERFVPLSHSAGLPPWTANDSRSSTPLSPYQLPLRMRPAPVATSRSSPPADFHRRAFLDEQAQRYSQWRNRQAAVLHKLAPDMWGRALPHYAALDRQPRVMDSGLNTHASHVRRSRYDNGVVFV